MKLLEMNPEGKTVVDDHEDNFAIVFAAMGVRRRRGVLYNCRG